jgi:predicted dehydrogenase
MGQAAHLRNYLTIPDCEVVAIAEVRPELARKVAERYGIARVYADHRELLAKEELDGIVAIQLFSNHAKLVPELLNKGVPVLTEKPLAESLDNGRKILDAVQRTGTPLYVAYNKRSEPAVARGVSQIADWRKTGHVGSMNYVRLTIPPGKWDVQGFALNVSTNESYEGSAWPPGEYAKFVNYYIHQVNLLRFLLGEDYKVQFADSNGRLLVAQTTSGIVGVIEMAPYNTTLDWQESAFVAFDRGYIKIKLPAPLVLDQAGEVEIFSDPGKGQEPQFVSPVLPAIHSMRAQAINFGQLLKGEAVNSVLCTADEAWRDLEIADQYLKLFDNAKGGKR